jgi:thiamine pyrophosphate-dependent acetolactate synthase large subunit-like protein
VLAAFRFHDRFDNMSDVYAGDAGVGMFPQTKKLISDADLIIAVNVRFGEMTTDAWSLLDVPNPKQRLVHIHSSDREIGKIYSAHVPVHAGPNQFAAAVKACRLMAAGPIGASPRARVTWSTSTHLTSQARWTWRRSWNTCATRCRMT